MEISAHIKGVSCSSFRFSTIYFYFAIQTPPITITITILFSTIANIRNTARRK